MSYCSSVRNSFCSSLIVHGTVLVVHFFVTSAQSKTAVSELKDTLSKVTFILVQPVNTISNRMFSLASSANNKRFSIWER